MIVNELIRRYNNNEELNKNELLEVAIYQIKILNPKLPQWGKWNVLAKQLINELLEEQKEVTTNKGMKKILKVDNNLAIQCESCNGTGINYQLRNNQCNCIRGWYYNNNVKILSEQDYKLIFGEKYLNKLNKKGLLSRYTLEELLKFNLQDFNNIIN